MKHIFNLIEEGCRKKGISKAALAEEMGIAKGVFNPSYNKDWTVSELQFISKRLEIPMVAFFQEDKIEISDKKKYKVIETIMNAVAELAPEYKSTIDKLQSKTVKQTKKKP